VILKSRINNFQGKYKNKKDKKHLKKCQKRVKKFIKVKRFNLQALVQKIKLNRTKIKK
jgi:hypothetical protein